MLSSLMSCGPKADPPASVAPVGVAPVDLGTGPAVATDVDPIAHRAAVDTWHAERIERLRAEDGWLSLVGLSWLTEGELTVGSAPGSAVELPSTAPALVGHLAVSNPTTPVLFRAAPDAAVSADGEPIGGGEVQLQSDASGKPTVLAVGSLRMSLLARNNRLALRIKDSAAPTRANFDGVERYPVDVAWRVVARFEPYDPPRMIQVPNVMGYVTEQLSPGALRFELAGESYSLDPVDEDPAPGEPLFVIFGDLTNRDTTYGAGRFLYVDPPDATGRVELDFNRAYNPPCAFTPYATCPLPPAQNKLAVRVEAGEKRASLH